MSTPPAPPSLKGMPVEQYLSDPARKQAFVTPMFDIIAPRYDAFTRLFSFGMDSGWKEELIAWAAASLHPATVALDLACGTGDLAFALASLAPRAHITGIDASDRMIRLAIARQERGEHPPGASPPGPPSNSKGGSSENLGFRVGDLSQLSEGDASVDVITAGYAFRNVPDVRQALGEAARVLKPGGHLYTLDFYRPATGWWRALLLAYLSAAGNAVGWLWHGEPVVYGYIARSIDHFVSAEQFSTLLTDAGFTVERASPKLFGGIALHAARRVG